MSAGWTTADERRARIFTVGDRVRIRSYYPPRIPKWRVGDTGTVVRITRKQSIVVNVDGTEHSCPPECLEPVGSGTMSDATEMKHDPRCPTHGNPRWTDVGECGPCDSLARSDAPQGPPEDCECGDCYYVTPDCCGDPRPRCETGSAHDYYVCSVGMGCDAERDRDAEADALLARMLLDDPVRHLMASGGVTACGVASDTLTPRTLTTFCSAVTCTTCRETG